MAVERHLPKGELRAPSPTRDRMLGTVLLAAAGGLLAVAAAVEVGIILKPKLDRFLDRHFPKKFRYEWMLT